METKILSEIQDIRMLLAKILGTEELPKERQFSMEAIEKIAAVFKKLSIERGEWIAEEDISKIIRKAPYRSGSFIIEQFGFSNYFKWGRTLYFNRKDLMALNTELKARNINLRRYMELINDQEKFNKLVKSAKRQAGKKNQKHFRIPDWLRDIDTRSYSPPSEEIIMNHIVSLKNEFEKSNYTEYIDIYHDDYAMFKFLYHFDRYLNPELKRRCKNWCDEFNYANHALKESKRPY